MDLRLANTEDLPKLKLMYKKIVHDMNKNNIAIWNEIYPSEFLSDDIKNSCLYILVEKHNIAGAFALYGTNQGESYMKWKNPSSKALYLERFAVNVDYARQGVASLMIKHAIKLTKEKDIKFLRLFVVDINKPAIDLYLKNDFGQVDGIYEIEMFDLRLVEYGFELEILN